MPLDQQQRSGDQWSGLNRTTAYKDDTRRHYFSLLSGQATVLAHSSSIQLSIPSILEITYPLFNNLADRAFLSFLPLSIDTVHKSRPANLLSTPLLTHCQIL
jgi:hypothetical protein